MALPLESGQGLDLMRSLVGAFCTMLLGDVGADVTKAEPAMTGDMIRGW